MKVGQILITHFIQIHCLFAISLHYDATNHYYDDLLISISPDVQGEKNHVYCQVKVSNRFCSQMILTSYKGMTMTALKILQESKIL